MSIAHSLFAAGIPASYNPMAPMSGYGLLGQGGPSPFAPPSSNNQASKHTETQDVMQDVFWKEQFSEEFNDRSFLSDAAAQAAWWQVASQMDYLARLQHAAAASASAGSSSGRGGGGGSGGGASSSSSSGVFSSSPRYPASGMKTSTRVRVQLRLTRSCRGQCPGQ